jgi:nitrogen fixation protein
LLVRTFGHYFFEANNQDKVKVYVPHEDLAEAIKHVHSKALLSMATKLKNVVRFDGRLYHRLDAATRLILLSAEKQFSSGVLPPEMIQELDFQDCEMFDRYFEETRGRC